MVSRVLVADDDPTIRQLVTTVIRRDQCDVDAVTDGAAAIEALKRDYQVELASGDARRNIVTRNVPLNHLVGMEFAIGEVRIRGIRLCEPCDHLQKVTGKSVIKGLLHRGGLRAQILTPGTISVGDKITIP